MSSIDSAQNPTHQRFVRDLVVDSGFAAILVNYTPSPEAHNPTAINEAYAAKGRAIAAVIPTTRGMTKQLVFK
jgi:acetyl esterase/lipase